MFSDLAAPNAPTVPVHLPGTGRFIPPQECKLKFPFKSNPAHRLSWGPATAALQALGLADVTIELLQDDAKTHPPVPNPANPSNLTPANVYTPTNQPPALLPLPFPGPPPRMRSPSPNRNWQQRSQGGFQQNYHQNQNQNQRRYRRNSLDNPGNYDMEQHQNGGQYHQGRPRERRGVSPNPGGGARGGGNVNGNVDRRDFQFNNPNRYHQHYHHPYYNPHNAPFQPFPNYNSLPRNAAQSQNGGGGGGGSWGFQTPPRMRRQFSAPDLKNNSNPSYKEANM